MMHWKTSHRFDTIWKASIWTEHPVRTFGIKANCCACAKAYSNCSSAPLLSCLLRLCALREQSLNLPQLVLIDYRQGTLGLIVCYMLITHIFVAAHQRECVETCIIQLCLSTV